MNVMSKWKFVLVCLPVGFSVFGESNSLIAWSQGSEETSGEDLPDGDKLVVAIASGDYALVKDLLGAGADPNSLTTQGYLPLQTAVLLGAESPTDYGLVKVLIDHGANPNQLDSDGLSPMDEAAKHGTEAIMSALLDAGGTPTCRTMG